MSGILYTERSVRSLDLVVLCWGADIVYSILYFHLLRSTRYTSGYTINLIFLIWYWQFSFTAFVVFFLFLSQVFCSSLRDFNCGKVFLECSIPGKKNVVGKSGVITAHTFCIIQPSCSGTDLFFYITLRVSIFKKTFLGTRCFGASRSTWPNQSTWKQETKSGGVLLILVSSEFFILTDNPFTTVNVYAGLPYSKHSPPSCVIAPV